MCCNERPVSKKFMWLNTVGFKYARHKNGCVVVVAVIVVKVVKVAVVVAFSAAEGIV